MLINIEHVSVIQQILSGLWVIMKFILDCESKTSALSALSIGFGCSEQEMTNFLRSINLEEVYTSEIDTENAIFSDIYPIEDYLYNSVCDKFGMHETPVAVNWFHNTRTFPSNNFSDGIKPLGDVIDWLWSSLIKYAPNKETGRLLGEIRNGGCGGPYLGRIDSKRQWGPYAFLIRDTALNPEKARAHDYLKMPEIITDILTEFKKEYKCDISPHYEKILQPKIVKFTSSNGIFDYEKDYIDGALHYIYNCILGAPIDENSVKCFNAYGQAIEKEQVLSVEVVGGYVSKK